MTVRITADRDRCAGAGRCASIAPEVFDQDDDGLVVVLRAQPDELQHADVKDAVELCPVGALRRLQ